LEEECMDTPRVTKASHHHAHSPCYTNVVPIYSPCYTNVIPLHSPCYTNVTILHSPCYTHVTPLHSPCYTNVTPLGKDFSKSTRVKEMGWGAETETNLGMM
jgi:hypothetical protein